ncbi:MAG: MFS transporter [Rhizobiaceae bacterium]
MQSAIEEKPPLFEWRLCLLYSALFIPNAIHLSFFPLWLERRGLDAVEISTLLTLPVFVRLLVTPILTQVADNAKERADILVALSGASLLFAAMLLYPLGYWGILVVIMILAAFWSPQVPIADSIALSGVRRYGIDYPSVRIWGSVLFLCTNVAAGLIIQRTSADLAVMLMVAGFALIFGAAFVTPRLGKRRQPDQGLFSSLRILKNPLVLLILVATGLIQGSHGLMYNFGSIYWQSLGISSQQVGFLWAVPVISEIVLFRCYSRLFGKWKPQSILAVAGSISIVRWILFSSAPLLGLGFYGFSAVQMLHGFTFGATYLAQQAFLAHAVPEEQAGAAQGMSVLVHGIIMVAVMFVSGPLYAAFGGRGFIVMTAVAAAGIAAGFAFAARIGASKSPDGHSTP